MADSILDGLNGCVHQNAVIVVLRQLVYSCDGVVRHGLRGDGS